MGKPIVWFLNRSDTNQPVQSQKTARSMEFWILEEDELCYPRSENKGADHKGNKGAGYHEADLRLCFRLVYFPTRRLINDAIVTANYVFVDHWRHAAKEKRACLLTVYNSSRNSYIHTLILKK